MQVVPDGARPERAAARLEVFSFADARFADLLAELDIIIDRVGIPGVHDKAASPAYDLPLDIGALRKLERVIVRRQRLLLDH